MSEFNGKKFYGYSLHNDPALSTSARNFEFKYTRPEQLERAIQKVQSTDLDKQKKSALLNKYCKEKKKFKDDPLIPHQNRDTDIETHISRRDLANLSKIRTLSANEIDLLIGKVRSNGEILPAQSNLETGAAAVMSRDYKIGDANEQYRSEEDQYGCDSSSLKYVSYTEYDNQQPQWVEIIPTPKTSTMTVGEIIKKEVKPSEYGDSLNTRLVKLPLHPVSGIAPNSGTDADEGIACSMPNIMPVAPFEPIDQDTFYVEDSDLEYEMMGRADYTKLCGPRPKEDEMANASNDSGGFPEFIQVEPKIPRMDLSFLKNASPMRYSDLTDDTPEEQNRFETSDMKVYIKPSKQIENQVDTQQDIDKNPIVTMAEKETTTSKKPESSSKLKKKSSKSKAPSGVTHRKDHSQSPRLKHSKTIVSNPSSPNSHSPRQRAKAYSSNLNSQRNTQQNHVVKEGGTRPVHHHHASNGAGNSNRDINNNNNNNNTMMTNLIDIRSIKNIVLTKSIEELKVEKMAIFGKMTSTQERIIEILDKLRINLLEMYVPDNIYEKTKRQKNAFEFSVRFSRNFLYPLKGMIEDLRLLSIEQLNSASSNEACSRVATIFGLIKQSLETYHKQLRYFLLDQVPQKLNALIELISAALNICLEKGVFDPNDAIIDCLQDRCKKFINFLEDMHEERFLTARENYRKASFEKSPSNYNLKMFMNDLNMYEPKLVPKNIYCRTRRSNNSNDGPSSSGINQRKMVGKISSSEFTGTNNNMNEQKKLSKNHLKKHQKSPNASASTDASDTNVSRPDGDTIATQVQATSINSSSCMIKSEPKFESNSSTDAKNILDLDANFGDSNAHLNKAIIEALQTVTKEQVRQVLEPIIQTLGSAFDKKNTSKTIESILSAFNSNVISITQAEYKRRHDDDKYKKGHRVKDNKVSGKTLANRAQQQYATKTSKAAKHTKKLRQRKCYESSSAVNRNEANDVDDEDGGVDADDDDVDDNDCYNNNKNNNDDEDGGYKGNDRGGSGGRGSGGNSANTKNKNKYKNIEKFDEFDTQEDDDDDDDVENDGHSICDGDGEDDECDDDYNKNSNKHHDNHDNHEPNDDDDDDDDVAVESSTESKLSETASESESTEEGKSYHSIININNDFNAVVADKQHNINIGNSGGGNGSNSHHKKNKTLEQQQHELELHFQQQMQEQHLKQQYLKQQKQKQRDLKQVNCQKISNAFSSPEITDKVLKNSNNRRAPRKSATANAIKNTDAGQKRHNKSKLLKKRRHPLLPPPPAPAGTPSTSARNRSAREDNDPAMQMEQFWSAVENHHSSSDIDTGGCGDAQEVYENINDEVVPFTNAFKLDSNENNFCILNNFTKMQNCYIDDAITKCLFNREENDYSKNMGSTSDGAGDEKLCNKQPIGTTALYTDESPYDPDQTNRSQKKLHQKKLLENQIRQKMEERQYKELQRQQVRKHQKKQEKEIIDAKVTDIKMAEEQRAYENRPQKSPRKLDLRVESMLNERNGFLKLCSKNRFYSNPNYNEPWKVFSKISNEISNEIVGLIEKDFTIGVSKFVQDFLEAETHN